MAKKTNGLATRDELVKAMAEEMPAPEEKPAISPEEAQAVLLSKQKADCEAAQKEFAALRGKWGAHGIEFVPFMQFVGSSYVSDIVIRPRQ